MVFQLNVRGDNLYKPYKKFRKTISIDLDGVLNQYKGNYDENNIPKIKDGAKELIIQLHKDYDLILFTTRKQNNAKKWLIENELDEFLKI